MNTIEVARQQHSEGRTRKEAVQPDRVATGIADTGFDDRSRQAGRVEHRAGRARRPASRLDTRVPDAVGVVIPGDDEEIDVSRQTSDRIADGTNRASRAKPWQVIVGKYQNTRPCGHGSAPCILAARDRCVMTTNTTMKTADC